MKVSELISVLHMFPSELEVYYEGGGFKGDWRRVRGASVENNFASTGLLIGEDTKVPTRQPHSKKHIDQ